MFASFFSVGLLVSSALAATIDVTVGGTNGELVFNPEAIVSLLSTASFHFEKRAE